ncbi:serine hydrolase domain-containing protein [Paenibacillus sp. 1P03SA]|uniref:serine hydrolase domain-containing protein n=1 Tax=Paenibacillus sp. 1P03SA TaxID=3132294 RepID=UPI00399F1D7C
MKKMVSLLMSVVFLAVPVAPALAQSMDDPVKEKAKVLASKIVSDYEVSGIQYAIRDHGSVVVSGGAGLKDKAAGTPVTKDTMFGIGSVSKMYATAAAMKLVDSRQIELDKPLTTYLKDFRMADERYRKITPRMLMNHSSGLYGSHYENGFLFDDNDTKTHDQLLTKLRSEHLKADPGEFSVYCNDGFQLLEILVERMSGLSYSEFLNIHFGQPLDLSSTKTPRDTFDRNRLAKTYAPGSDKAWPVENVNLIGTGGIYSTAEEISKFGDVLIGNRTDLLSEKSAKAMQSHEYRKGLWVPEESNAFNYGLGWDAVKLTPFDEYGITALSKGGDTLMYHATLTALPEHDISIAVLSSGGSSIHNSIMASNVLLEYVKKKGIIKEILPEKISQPAVKTDMPSELRAYSGLYGATDKMINLDIKDGEIDMPALGGLTPAQKFVYTGKGEFKNNEGNLTVSFDRLKNGKTYLKLNALLTFPGLGQTVMVVYESQKLDRNPLDPATKKVWEQRNGKLYYALDEKITSVGYTNQALLTKEITVNADYGYASGTKIVNKNKAVNAAVVPVMNGRDSFDLNFYKKNHKEYVTIAGQTYIKGDDIPPFSHGSSEIRSIPYNGQASWYRIDKQSAGRTLTVKAPADGEFAVYDAEGKLVNFSKISKQYSAVLPEGGLVVFGGHAGDVFKIDLKKN